jgi:hypothetical protein
VAIIVQPYTAETYEVYGSKENLTFTVDCRANDLQTASDLSELLRRELLIMRRTNMEADGITLFEASRSYVGLQRDLSGTAPQFVYSLTVSAMADWKVFVPLVTRLVTLEITSTATVSSYGPGISLTPRVKVFGNTKFLESYT